MKRSANKRSFQTFEHKKNVDRFNSKLIHKLIIFFCILLVLLVLCWIFILPLFAVKKEPNNKYSEGSLGTEGVFSSDAGIMSYDETLNITYFFHQNDEKIFLIIARLNPFFGSLNKIVLIFNRTTNNCNYNVSNPSLPTYYDINVSETDCGNNFTGVVSVDAYGIKNPVSINLTQNNNIPDIYLANYENRANALDLDNYFVNLSSGDPDLSFTYSSSPVITLTPAIDFINSRMISINNSINSNLSALTNITLVYPGIVSVVSNNFYIYIGTNCSESDFGLNYSLKGTANNFSSTGTDSCYNSTHLIEYYCSGNAVSNYLVFCSSSYYCSDGACIRNISANVPPRFITSNCNLTNRNWYKNENLTLDITQCFSDDNNDLLSYRFTPLDSSSLTIIQNGTTLKLTPANNWIGNGSFNLYATDGLNETSGIVYFVIKNLNTSINSTNNQTITPPIIINQSLYNSSIIVRDPSPGGDNVTDFYGNTQTFFVSNTDYDSLEWYLDGKLIKTNSNSCDIKNLSVGNHSVEVKIKRGTSVDSKVWKIVIQSNEKAKKFLFDAGVVMFIVIIIVVVIIIGLVVWLFVIENKKKNKRIDLDLEVMHEEKTLPGFARKDDMTRRFNIPK